MPRLLAVAAIAAALLVAPSPADACSCMAPKSPEVERDRAAAVFVGTVSDIAAQATNARLVTFEETSVIKGEPPTPLVVRTAASSASCGYNFEVGSEYLVYAFESNGQLQVGLCGRTALHRRADGDPVEEVAAEIAQLEASDPAGPTEPTEPTDPAEPPQPPPPPATAPQKRGCAGCSSPGGSGSTLLVLLLLSVVGCRLSAARRLNPPCHRTPGRGCSRRS